MRLTDILNNHKIQVLLEMYLSGRVEAVQPSVQFECYYGSNEPIIELGGSISRVKTGHAMEEVVHNWPTVLKNLLALGAKKYPGPNTPYALACLQASSDRRPTSIDLETLWLLARGVKIVHKPRSGAVYAGYYLAGEVPADVTEELERRTRELEIKRNKDEVSGSKAAREALRVLDQIRESNYCEEYKLRALCNLLGVAIPEEDWEPRVKVPEPSEPEEGVEEDEEAPDTYESRWEVFQRVQDAVEAQVGCGLMRYNDAREAGTWASNLEGELERLEMEAADVRVRIAKAKKLSSMLEKAGLTDRVVTKPVLGRAILEELKKNMAVLLVSEVEGERNRTLAQAIGKLGIDRILAGR